MTFRLSLLLFLKAIAMIALILFAGIGLGPDEAQYWTWSRHLDFGYYSKPPGIAWQIFLGTQLFGNSELGVRFGSVVLGSFLAWAVYRLAKEAKLSGEASFFAGLMAALTPFGVMATFFAITDVGMLLFFTLGLTEIVRAIEGKEARGWVLGCLIACGALFKWPVFLLLLIALFVFPLKEALIAGAFSFLGLLPTLYWNLSHDFATFRHVLTIAKGGPDQPARGNPFDFFGAQAAIVSPVLFGMLLFAWAKDIFLKGSSIRFLGRLSFMLFALFFAYSFFKKVQGNWALFFIPPAIAFLSYFFVERMRSIKLLTAGIALSLLLLACLFSIPSFLQEIPWKINPFKHNLGWDKLQDWVDQNQRGEELVADRYQTVSILSFYNGEKRQAHFLNLTGTRKNQFSYWPKLSQGSDCLFFVVDSPSALEKVLPFYTEMLPRFFEEVSPPQTAALVTVQGEPQKSLICYRCKKYNGMLPDAPEKY